MSTGRWIALFSLVSTPLLAQDPSPGFEDLLRALDDDSVEVRERATAALERLGEEARPALVLRQAETFSAEVRGRIAEILGRLDAGKRRREFKGGKAVCGFSARLEREGDARAGTLLFRVEIMNVGESPRELILVEQWDSWIRTGLFEYSNSHALLRIVRMGPGWEQTHGASIGICGSPSRVVERLQPGECRSFTYRVNCGRDEDGYPFLPGGDYEARVTYYALQKGLLPGAPEDLESNWVRFAVKE